MLLLLAVFEATIGFMYGGRNKPMMIESTEPLESFEAPDGDAKPVYTFESSELTVHCPFNFGGPDFYHLTIRYVPTEECIESRSLKRHLESLRDAEATAELLGNHLHQTISQSVQPDRLYVRLEQARRGGIEQTVEVGNRSLAETAGEF